MTASHATLSFLKRRNVDASRRPSANSVTPFGENKAIFRPYTYVFETQDITSSHRFSHHRLPPNTVQKETFCIVKDGLLHNKRPSTTN